jgi:hypothetical protein
MARSYYVRHQNVAALNASINSFAASGNDKCMVKYLLLMLVDERWQVSV